MNRDSWDEYERIQEFHRFKSASQENSKERYPFSDFRHRSMSLLPFDSFEIVVLFCITTLLFQPPVVQFSGECCFLPGNCADSLGSVWKKEFNYKQTDNGKIQC